MTVVAHVVGTVGILIGIGALAVGLGPSTDTNVIYHRMMLVVPLGGLAALWTATIRSGLEGHIAP